MKHIEKVMQRLKQAIVAGFFALCMHNIVAQQPAQDVPQGVLTKLKAGQPVTVMDMTDGNLLFLNTLLMGFSTALNNYLKNVQIESPILSRNSNEYGDEYEKNFSITGGVKAGNFVGRAKYVQAYDKEGKKHQSFTVSLPNAWKFSDFFPELHSLDNIDLPTGYIVVSDFEYNEPLIENGEIKRGVNILASVNLSGGLEHVGKLVRELLARKGSLGSSLVLEGGQFYMQGVINPKIQDTSLSLVVPIHIGVDFEELYRIGKLKKPSKAIKKLTTGDLIVSIHANAAINVETGIILTLMTQQQPLEFRAGVEAKPTGCSFIGKMDGIYDPAFGKKWLALGDFGIQVDIDYALLAGPAAIGIPFTGLGLRGKMGLGEGTDRTTLDLAGKVEISSDSIGDLAFIGSIDQINIRKFVQLLGKMAGKQIVLDTMPNILFNALRLYLVPSPLGTTIAGKTYEEGVAASGGITVDNFKGQVAFELKSTEGTFNGEGSMSPIRTPVFNFTGMKSEEGPALKFGVSTSASALSGFFLDGMIEFPTLNVLTGAHIAIEAEGWVGQVTAKIANLFDIMCDLEINPVNLANSYVAFEFNNNFGDFLLKELPGVLNNLRSQAQADIATWSSKIAEAQSGFSSDAQKELDRVNKRIAEIDGLLPNLKTDCFSVNVFERIGRKSCQDYDRLNLERGALVTYRDTILKPGTTVVQKTLESTKALTDYEGFKKAAQTVVDTTTTMINNLGKALSVVVFKRGKGSFNFQDLSQLKLLKLEIMEYQINIPGQSPKTILLKDLQFDFKNPQESTKYIIKQIIDNLTGLQLAGK